MAYEVDAKINAYAISKNQSAISLEIRNNEGKLGTLKIGKGSLMWKNANEQKLKRLDWRKVFELLNATIDQ